MVDIKKIAQSNIIDTLKLQDDSEEVKQEAINDATEIIFDSVVDRIQAELSDEALVEYDRVFGEENPEEERAAFLKKYVPNFEEIVAEEMLRYKYLTEIMVSSSKR